VKKILVIEDETIMLKAIEFKLKKEGYTVLTAENGRAGLQAVMDLAPDLVITDIMVPYITGLEIVDYIKNKNPRKLPVIVLSAVGLEKTVLEAFKLGADDFITKPFSPNELVVRVKRLLFV
jgi:two-component system, OmpR family, response regulator VicR